MIVFILYVKKPRHGEYRAQSRGQPVGGRLQVQALGRARAPAPPPRLCVCVTWPVLRVGFVVTCCTVSRVLSLETLG